MSKISDLYYSPGAVEHPDVVADDDAVEAQDWRAGSREQGGAGTDELRRNGGSKRGGNEGHWDGGGGFDMC